MTIDNPKDGILYGRRFDIRFFILVVQGKVYLHSNMYAMFSSPDKPYDPDDLSQENHVPKVGHYAGDNTHLNNRDFLFFTNTFHLEPNGTPSILFHGDWKLQTPCERLLKLLWRRYSMQRAMIRMPIIALEQMPLLNEPPAERFCWNSMTGQT